MFFAFVGVFVKIRGVRPKKWPNTSASQTAIIFFNFIFYVNQELFPSPGAHWGYNLLESFYKQAYWIEWL